MEPNQTPDSPQPTRSRVTSGILAAGAAFAMTLAGFGVAAAQTDEGTTPSTETPTTEAPAAEPTRPAENGMRGPHGGHCEGGPGRHRSTENALTGETADKVTAAAQAAVPDGEVVRVETDDDGATYEAHVHKADGTHVTVKLDQNFNVAGVEEHSKRS